MFARSQRFYDAIYSWKDYEAETRRLLATIEDRNPGARTLLDVACGTGKHLALLRDRFEVEGTDLDPEMLSLARERLGGSVPLHRADMKELDLGRTFDVVTCLFSSIAYARTPDGLEEAIRRMARHLAPGGVLVVEPFFTPDTFQPGQIWALFVDEPDLKIARMDLPEVEDGVAIMDFRYLVGTPGGIEHFSERHEAGLFTHRQHLDAFRAAGLDPDHDPEGLMGRGLYVGVRPG
jgi:SAM-dependent methyltransferase